MWTFPFFQIRGKCCRGQSPYRLCVGWVCRSSLYQEPCLDTWFSALYLSPQINIPKLELTCSSAQSSNRYISHLSHNFSSFLSHSWNLLRPFLAKKSSPPSFSLFPQCTHLCVSFCFLTTFLCVSLVPVLLPNGIQNSCFFHTLSPF